MEGIFIAEMVALGIALGGISWWLTRDKGTKDTVEQDKSPPELQSGANVTSLDTSVEPPKIKTSIFKRFQNPLKGLLSQEISDEALEDLEDTLLMADVGTETTDRLLQILKSKVKANASTQDLQQALRKELIRRLGQKSSLTEVVQSPLVILVIGVNGAGKTTTIGKLAHNYTQQGKKVLVAAGDTFRAGAVQQLQVWAERAGAEIVTAQPKADPASVFYNALESAKSKGFDVLICDTAGRLQEHSHLMEELKKIVKVGQKVVPDAPHEILLVLDSTIGQNALSQAEGFGKVADLTGVVLTKLDGTAKGGIVIAVRDRTGVPIKLIGTGEGIDDLHNFDPEDFVDTLLELGSDE